jgi:Calcium binding
MAKGKIKQDKGREERITMEIVVDAYGPEEQAMGWYYYLEDKLRFPFTAICNQKRAISPLHVKDEVDVIGMAPEEECEKEMFVLIQWEKDGLAVPLSQLTVIKSTDKQTKQAVEDWHYWVQRGYIFG